MINIFFTITFFECVVHCCSEAKKADLPKDEKINYSIANLKFVRNIVIMLSNAVIKEDGENG